MPITVVVTCLMGPGTFEGKIIPLSRSPFVKKIIILRKIIGPPIEKVEYVLLPGICRIAFFNIILTPLYLINLVKKNKADLILSYHIIPHAFFACIVSYFTRVPFNVSQTGLLIQKQVSRGIFRKAILYILKRSLFINVPGNSSRNFWIRNGIDENKINILHSKIDHNIFAPAQMDKEFDFIYLGRLSKEKRVNIIIDGIYNLKNRGFNPSLAIVGDGPEYQELFEKAGLLGLHNNIKFTGFVSNPEDWLNISKICILSSESEGLPTALMQAMSCRLIVIAPYIGNISDLVEDKVTGYLFKVNDIQCFNKLLRDTILAFDSLGLMRDKAREKIIVQYSYQNATEAWNSIIKNKFSNS
jgi:glycosyltransferase involved in cell wall biosynthesis